MSQTPKMSRDQRRQHEQNMAKPENRFLNATGEDGKLKYPIADKIRKYVISNADMVTDEMRMSNALLHEIRFHKTQAEMYQSEFDKGVTQLKNEYGLPLSAEQCYVKHIAEHQAIYTALSKLRQHITIKLLSMCDGDMFTFDKYNEYVTKVDGILAGMHLDLFPDKIDVINPL